MATVVQQNFVFQQKKCMCFCFFYVHVLGNSVIQVPVIV